MSSHSLNSWNNKTVSHSVHSSLEINKLSSSPWDNITSILSGLQSSMDLRSAAAQFPVKISVFLSGHEQTYPSRFVHIPFQFLLKSQFENHSLFLNCKPSRMRQPQYCFQSLLNKKKIMIFLSEAMSKKNYTLR